MVVTTKGTLKCKTLAKGVAMDKNQLRFHGVIFKETIVMNMVPNSPPSPSCRSNRAPATMFHKSSFTDIKTAFNRGFKVTCWSWLQLFVLFMLLIPVPRQCVKWFANVLGSYSCTLFMPVRGFKFGLLYFQTLSISCAQQVSIPFSDNDLNVAFC